jgi:hypothetical protein
MDKKKKKKQKKTGTKGTTSGEKSKNPTHEGKKKKKNPIDKLEQRGPKKRNKNKPNQTPTKGQPQGDHFGQKGNQ